MYNAYFSTTLLSNAILSKLNACNHSFKLIQYTLNKLAMTSMTI